MESPTIDVKEMTEENYPKSAKLKLFSRQPIPPFKLIDIEDMRNDRYIMAKFKLNDPFNV